jgi:hypothetical protein
LWLLLILILIVATVCYVAIVERHGRRGRVLLTLVPGGRGGIPAMRGAAMLRWWRRWRRRWWWPGLVEATGRKGRRKVREIPWRRDGREVGERCLRRRRRQRRRMVNLMRRARRI